MDRAIDLNCDLGEGCDNDAELMRYISSANIACGYHAGDTETMRRTVELALENSVAIGAHPGYNDKANFGRTPMSLSPREIHDLIANQMVALQNICDALGARVRHVKPHGALYNQAAKERELAAAIAEAIAQVDPNLTFFGLSGSVMIDEAERAGLRTASEVFADRTYRSDGTLTPRTESNALVEDENTSLTQVLDMINYGRVRSTDAIMIPIKAETICIHGDGDHAVDFARLIRKELDVAGIAIHSPFRD